jgi:hypothetical protein
MINIDITLSVSFLFASDFLPKKHKNLTMQQTFCPFTVFFTSYLKTIFQSSRLFNFETYNDETMLSSHIHIFVKNPAC